MNLSEATDVLTDSVLHVRNATFSLEKKHRAIKQAGYRFTRMTKCSWENQNIALAASVSTVDITSTISDFYEDQFIRARIGSKRVSLSSYDDMIQEFEDITPTGQPTKIGFDIKSNAKLNTETDSAYTMVLTRRKPFVSFNPGDETDPTLNIPEEWAWDVIWFGARSALLRGAPGHPEVETAEADFNRLIQEASSQYFPTTKSGVTDRQVAT